MKTPVMAIFDKKTGLYETQLLTARHVALVQREFSKLCQSKENKYGNNPEDFSLHQIANFDDELGEFQKITPHVTLATGISDANSV